jgi:hypothetical protein
MKYLTLDYSKWRCGTDGPYKLGEGRTLLKNHEGFMCCLGQFAPQLNPKVAGDLLDGAEPCELPRKVKLLNKKGEWDNIVNTQLSKEAMNINDYKDTSPEEKIAKLRVLFKKHGYIIRVINRKAQ